MNYADEHALYTGRLVDNSGKKALEWAINEHNFSLAQMSEEEQIEITNKSAPLIEKWKKNAMDKGLDADAILADIQAFRAIYKEKYAN